ncbi:MAG: hypothetical protein ABIE07_08080 [Candidatus Zixiibacteriota bacterium]
MVELVGDDEELQREAKQDILSRDRKITKKDPSVFIGQWIYGIGGGLADTATGIDRGM